MCEISDTGFSVVHAEVASSAFELEDWVLDSRDALVRRLKHDFEQAFVVGQVVLCFVLVSERVSGDDDGFGPAWDELRDVADEDGFSEDCAVEDVSDCAVGALPHFGELELFDSFFIGGDRCAFDADPVFLDCLCGFNGDMV